MSTHARTDIARRILALLDLTELGDQAMESDVIALAARARGQDGLPPVAAVCVWPRHVALVREALAGSPVKIVTVVNFPSGNQALPDVLAEVDAALLAGADEIDLVLPWRGFLAGDEAGAAAMAKGVRKALPAGIVLKVILETGAYPDVSAIRRAADLAIGAGAHFIKTSTGKAGSGATPEAARAMLRAILSVPRAVGLKPSGGIRSLDDAAQYLALADDTMGPGWVQPETFRFGASSLYDALVAEISGDGTAEGRGGY